MYKSGWIVLNGVPTCVRTWGNWIEDDFNSESVILFITGNPGITDFYEKFLGKLHKLTNIPVWALCHAGNQIPSASENNMKMPSINKNPDLYNLNGQIKHKQEFLSTYIPKSKKIYLIGHSIGAKVCVELMKEVNIAKNVEQMHLMFPTLQHISDTPNGKIFRHFLYRISPFLIALAWVFTCFPFKIRAACVYLIIILYNLSFKIETCCVNGLIKLFHPKVLKGVFFLANDEMIRVKELDNEVYEKNIDKMHVYYGQNDRWAPLYQYEDLKMKYPSISSQILEEYFTHSFVFASSEEAASKVYEQLKKGGLSS